MHRKLSKSSTRFLPGLFEWGQYPPGAPISLSCVKYSRPLPYKGDDSRRVGANSVESANFRKVMKKKTKIKVIKKNINRDGIITPNELAKTYKVLYDAFLSNGFSNEQSFQLLLVALRR